MSGTALGGADPVPPRNPEPTENDLAPHVGELGVAVGPDARLNRVAGTEQAPWPHAHARIRA